MLSADSKPDTANRLVLRGAVIVSIVTLLISKYYVAKWMEGDNTAQES